MRLFIEVPCRNCAEPLAEASQQDGIHHYSYFTNEAIVAQRHWLISPGYRASQIFPTILPIKAGFLGGQDLTIYS